MKALYELAYILCSSYSEWYENFRERAGLVICIGFLTAPNLLTYQGSLNVMAFLLWMVGLIGLTILLGAMDFESRELKDKLKHLAFEKNRDKIKLAILYKEFDLTSANLRERLDAIEKQFKELEKK